MLLGQSNLLRINPLKCWLWLFCLWFWRWSTEYERRGFQSVDTKMEPSEYYILKDLSEEQYLRKVLQDAFGAVSQCSDDILGVIWQRIILQKEVDKFSSPSFNFRLWTKPFNQVGDQKWGKGRKNQKSKQTWKKINNWCAACVFADDFAKKDLVGKKVLRAGTIASVLPLLWG